MFNRFRKMCGLVLILGVTLSGVSPAVDTPSKAADTAGCTIIFDYNDGSGRTDTVKKAAGEQVLITNSMYIHDGFTFIGWALDPLAIRADYSVGEYFKEEEDTTLYAIWRRIGEGADNYLKYKRSMTVNDQTGTCGKSFTLKYDVEEEGENIVFKSSDTKILSLGANGKGTPKSCGILDMTVTTPEDGLFAETTKTVSITIKPATTTITKLKSPKKAWLACSWKKCAGVTGYQVRIVKGGITSYLKWKKTSFTASATSNKTYKVKVRGYKKVGTKTIYGAWSKEKKVKVK